MRTPVGRFSDRQRSSEQRLSLEALVSLHAWQELATLGVETLRGLSGMNIHSVAKLTSFEPHSAVEIGLDATAARTALRMIIEIDAASSDALAAVMMGNGHTTSLVDDMLRETANTAAGAFVRLALRDACELTMGLPQTIPVELARQHLAEGDIHHSVGLVTLEGPLRLRLHVVARPRENVLIDCSMLREGMIPASDIVSPDGGVLVRSGTRLSVAEVERVRSALGMTPSVLIAEQSWSDPETSSRTPHSASFRVRS